MRAVLDRVFASVLYVYVRVSRRVYVLSVYAVVCIAVFIAVRGLSVRRASKLLGVMGVHTCFARLFQLCT